MQITYKIKITKNIFKVLCIAKYYILIYICAIQSSIINKFNYKNINIMTSKYEELQKLNKLFTEGIITEEEYVKEKSKLLDNEQRRQSNQSDDQNSYNTLMHLSQFSNYLLPTLGLIVPIIMWLGRKDESKSVNANGKIILNWNISLLIYSLVVLFIFIGVGGFSALSFAFSDTPELSLFGLLGSISALILPMLLFAVLDFIFTIIGAIKANRGEVWNYPLSIKFFKIE